MTTELRDTFLRTVESARGTVVFGGGVPSASGEVSQVGEDYLLIEADDGGEVPEVLLVPLSSVAYFRFEAER